VRKKSSERSAGGRGCAGERGMDRLGLQMRGCGA
jgi:hypothetical protein